MRTSQYLSDAEFTSFLNASLAELDAILVSKFNDYKITPVIVSVVASTNYINLPSDFLKLRGMDVYYNPGNIDGYLPMSEYSWEHRNKKIYPINGPSVLSPYHFEYRLQGQQIVIVPATAAANYSYRLWYVPDFIQLVSPTDTLQPYMDSQMWFDYAITDTAAKVETMQNNAETAQLLTNQAALSRQHIITLATPNRNMGEPKSVVDSRGYYGNFPYGSDW